MHSSKSFSFKFYDLFLIQLLIQPFSHPNILLESKLLYQGSIEQEHLSKNVKNSRSSKEISFSTESHQLKPTIHDFLILIALPDFGVTTAILNIVYIFCRRWKLNFGLLGGHVKSRHFTAVLLKR